MRKKEILVCLLLIVLAAAVLIPLASQSPDGLEKVAKDVGFAAKESGSPAGQPFADYRIPGIDNKNVSSVISGLLGALAMFCTGWGIASLLRRWRSR